jgi:hypothetical protein
MGTIARGLVAGAVGTLLLDATTHLDLALTGRPASDTPAGPSSGLGLGVVVSAARAAGVRVPTVGVRWAMDRFDRPGRAVGAVARDVTTFNGIS